MVGFYHHQSLCLSYSRFIDSNCFLGLAGLVVEPVQDFQHTGHAQCTFTQIMILVYLIDYPSTESGGSIRQTSADSCNRTIRTAILVTP